MQIVSTEDDLYVMSNPVFFSRWGGGGGGGDGELLTRNIVNLAFAEFT